MSGFGEWLQGTELNLTEVTTLRAAVAGLGANWPMTLKRREDYITKIRSNIQDAEQQRVAIEIIDRIWPLYELHDRAAVRPQSRGTISLSPISVGVTVVVVVVLYLLLLGIAGSAMLQNLAKIDIARGLLTFLFGITTVGIAFVVVIGVFLGTGDAGAPNELGERFQRGKDILTILIGVFGAIIGFYFGSEKNAPANVPPGTPPATSASPR